MPVLSNFLREHFWNTMKKCGEGKEKLKLEMQKMAIMEIFWWIGLLFLIDILFQSLKIVITSI